MPVILLWLRIITIFSFASAQLVIAKANQSDSTESALLLTTLYTINHQLEQMVSANFTALPDTPLLIDNADTKQLRYIVVKLQKTYLELQTLRQLHGLMIKETPEITPTSFSIDNLSQLIKNYQSDVNELAQVMRIDFEQTNRSISNQGNTVSNIHQQLSYTTELIYALGAPAIIPNDVYRVADTIVKVLERIRLARNINTSPEITQDRAFKPSQVFAKGLELAAFMNDISKTNQDLQIPGGYWLGQAPSSEVQPTDVMDLLFSILADLAHLQWRSGVTDSIKIQPARAGMMPIDVYQRISYALALAQTLK